MTIPLWAALSDPASSVERGIRCRSNFGLVERQVAVEGARCSLGKTDAQEAVELMYADGDKAIPAPTYDLRKLHAHEVNDGNGSWTFIDIDLSKFSHRAIRLNISLPERIVQQIDATAEKRHMSRSAFLALAAQHEMQRV